MLIQVEDSITQVTKKYHFDLNNDLRAKVASLQTMIDQLDTRILDFMVNEPIEYFQCLIDILDEIELIDDEDTPLFTFREIINRIGARLCSIISTSDDTEKDISILKQDIKTLTEKHYERGMLFFDYSDVRDQKVQRLFPIQLDDILPRSHIQLRFIE